MHRRYCEGTRLLEVANELAHNPHLSAEDRIRYEQVLLDNVIVHAYIYAFLDYAANNSSGERYRITLAALRGALDALIDHLIELELRPHEIVNNINQWLIIGDDHKISYSPYPPSHRLRATVRTVNRMCQNALS